MPDITEMDIIGFLFFPLYLYPSAKVELPWTEGFTAPKFTF